MEQASEQLERWLAQVGAAEALTALGELLPDAVVFVVDAERNLLYWSKGAERVLGYRAGEVLGKHCLSANRCHQCMTGCGIAEYKAVRDVPLQLYNAAGEIVPLRKTARAFFDEGGNFSGGIEVLVPDEKPPVMVPSLGGEGPEHVFHGMTTRDPRMLHVFEIVHNVARSDATVLVRGESGTGKELVARAIHAESHRGSKPFLAINCAAMTPSLLESELFGHERGAFTGAIARHIGLLERANGGTIFLDEIADLPLELQAKILRVLEARSFRRVGGGEEISIDVRIVSATHKSLRDEAAAGRFREDLMYRLRVVPLFLPPLRERRGDIPLLLRCFLERLNVRSHRRVSAVSPEAMRALLDHPWPGNIRELQNVLEYAFAVGSGGEIRLDDLPPEFREAALAGPAGAAGTAARKGAPPGMSERERIRWALNEADGHVGNAAELLGLSRPTFWRKRKKYGIG